MPEICLIRVWEMILVIPVKIFPFNLMFLLLLNLKNALFIEKLSTNMRTILKMTMPEKKKIFISVYLM